MLKQSAGGGTGQGRQRRLRDRALPAPLRRRRFLIVWAGQSCSQIGSGLAPITLTLAVLQEDTSASDLGLVLGVMFLCEVLSALPGGVWADRLPRNVLMIGAEVVRTCAQLTAAIQLISGHPSTAVLLVAAGCTGAASGVFQPAAAGLLQSLVPREELQQANALMGISQRVAALAGPAAATALTLAIGPGWGLVADAATFMISAATLAALPVRRTAKVREPFTAELAEGWREVRRHRWYWTNLIGHALWNLGRCVFFTVGALVVVRSLGGEFAWGMIAQAGAVGALAGALIALRIKTSRPLVVANVCMALGCLPLALIALHAHAIVIAVATALMNSALGLSSTLWDATVQRRIPPELISRVDSLGWLLSTAMNPAGMALAGTVAVAVGPGTTLGVSAFLVAGSSLGLLAVRSVRAPEPAAVPSGT
ncbi:MFS transporter [Streptomyces sp. NPDC127112]|uniref:MFS transporter n=1 Tax=Streptomyces sp. NPDC127112 TaxID=3345364 RepID=UPI0036277D07